MTCLFGVNYHFLLGFPSLKKKKSACNAGDMPCISRGWTPADDADRFRGASQGLSVGAAATGRLWWCLYCRLFELSNKGAKVRSARPKNLRL